MNGCDALQHVLGKSDIRCRDINLQLFHRGGADDDGGHEGARQAEGNGELCGVDTMRGGKLQIGLYRCFLKRLQAATEILVDGSA